MAEITIRKPRPRIRGRLLASLFVLGGLGLWGGAGAAQADTTHPFIGTLKIPGVTGSIMPSAVDDEGNLIVWRNDITAVAKYDPNGNPVNFTGLGTNILDGEGGKNCPSVPSDCDRVPTTEGFWSPGGREGYTNEIVAVDHSGGPTDGYIYVDNNTNDYNYPNPNHLFYEEIDVFSPAGVYLGKINQDLVSPITSEVYWGRGEGISVSSTGVLYHALNYHVDAFVPIDGNPAHDEFIGQLQPTCDETDGCFYFKNNFTDVAGAANYVYAVSYGHWFQFPLKELLKHGFHEGAVPIDYSHGTAPEFSAEAAAFEEGGFDPKINGLRDHHVVDPISQDVYIAGADIQQYDEHNTKIGPDFGWGHIFPYTVGMTIDRSGTATDDRIYITGPEGNDISIFGPPVTIPDIEVDETEIKHTSAHIEATVSTAGGPKITGCHIEYGTNRFYGNSVPCNPPGEYTTDTQVSFDFGGLFTEDDYHYRVVASNANGTNDTGDLVFHTHAVLGVTTDPASELTESSAKLNGSLDPDGMDTEYRFEWGSSSEYSEKTPLVDAGSSSGEMQVPPAVIENLQAGRTYHYRIVAKNALGKSKGPDRTLTVPATPRIGSLDARNVSATSADLTAKLNPLGFATTYYFEYGPTSSYGSSTATVELGADLEDHLAEAHLSELKSGVTYYFRLIAENQWGRSVSGQSTFSFFPPSCPNEHVRQQVNASYLPDCRAYELVSPSDAGSVTLFPSDIVFGGLGRGFFESDPRTHLKPQNSLGLATSPSRFGFFGGLGSINGLTPPNSLIDRYVSTRTNGGWVTTYPGRPGSQTLMAIHPLCNDHLDLCIDYPGGDFFGGLEGENGAYLWNVGGKFLGRLPTNFAVVPGAKSYVGEDNPSADFSHFVFTSRNVAFAPGGLEQAPGSAYDNDVQSEGMDIVSKLPDGSAIPQDTGDQDEFIRLPAVSTNGSHILMSTVGPLGTVHLYMRVNDAVTYDITDGVGVKFVGMTRNGDEVAFLSEAQLTPDDTDGSDDLYIWSEKTGEITRISQGNGNGNSDACNATWTAGCGALPLSPERPALDNLIAPRSGDVYFYSPEQLDPSNPGVHNDRNLYVYREGHVQYVTTLDPGTEIDRMQISPDGAHAAFLTRSRVTGYDNEHWEEMYTFNPLTGDIRCGSCLPNGDPPTIGHLLPELASTTVVKDAAASTSGPFMTDDGRIAFSTADALVPADTNRTIDVYEFVNNRPQLITAGTGSRVLLNANLFYPGLDTGFEGFSADGTDLYFSTFDTLVPQDRNGNFVKFYDARANGGFPFVPGLLPCTAADECHGDNSPSPAQTPVATGAGLGGGGNASGAGKKPRHKATRHRKRHHKRKHGRPHRGGRHG